MGDTLKSKYKAHSVISWEQIKNNPSLLPEADAIIQLSGANIMEKNWSDARKKEIIDSRVGMNKILVDAINKVHKTRKVPTTFITQSGVGYYPQTDAPNPPAFDENYSGPPDKSFPADITLKWEGILNEISPDVQIRKVFTRCGVVIGKKGALEQMLPTFKLGLGATFASGNQYFPWIHVQDVADMFVHILENPSIKGPVNMVAPQAVSNSEFTKTLGKVLHRPTFLFLPEFVMNIMFQDRAMLLTKGCKVVPKKALDSGFKYKFPKLEEALRDATSK